MRCFMNPLLTDKKHVSFDIRHEIGLVLLVISFTGTGSYDVQAAAAGSRDPTRSEP